jgi:hypothetical protein
LSFVWVAACILTASILLSACDVQETGSGVATPSAPIMPEVRRDVARAVASKGSGFEATLGEEADTSLAPQGSLRLSGFTIDTPPESSYTELTISLAVEELDFNEAFDLELRYDKDQLAPPHPSPSSSQLGVVRNVEPGLLLLSSGGGDASKRRRIVSSDETAGSPLACTDPEEARAIGRIDFRVTRYPSTPGVPVELVLRVDQNYASKSSVRACVLSAAISSRFFLIPSRAR